MGLVRLDTATVAECGTLALLNRGLILAERSDNTMHYDALVDRMRGFLEGNYAAWLFRVEDMVVGYCLVDMSSTPRYLRHFFIVEAYRGRGYGRAAFDALCDTLGAAALDIDVLDWNTAGAAFWRRMGFVPRYTRMRRPEAPR
ncbi:MAG: hypothetical protein RLZZ297_600 [Chloroflexota bacterium]|jgi:predicted acetyltransferase